MLKHEPGGEYLMVDIKNDRFQFIVHKMKIHEGSGAVEWYDMPMITISYAKLKAGLDREMECNES